MRKSISLIGTLLISISQLFALQDSTYTFVINDTISHQFSVQLDTVTQQNLGIIVGIQAGTRPLNVVDFHTTIGVALNQKWGYWNATIGIPAIANFDQQYDKLNNNSYLQTTNDFAINTPIESVIGIHIWDTLKISKAKYRVQKELVSDSSNAYYFFKPKRKFWTARVGYYSNQSIVSSSYLNNSVNLDDISIPKGTGSITSTDSPIYHTNFSTNSITLGIEHTTARFFTLKNDSLLHQRKNSISYFADFMFSPVVNIQDMEIRNFESGEKNVYSIADKIEVRKWGVRIGATVSIPFSKKSSFQFSAETGMRPGIANVYNEDNILGSELFAQLRLAYSFGVF